MVSRPGPRPVPAPHRGGAARARRRRNIKPRNAREETRRRPVADLYDAIGPDYAATRRPDPRIAAVITGALGGLESVVNVGAGTGSYEPEGKEVIAVEPSAAMRAQRPAGAARCLAGVAERLPLPYACVDAAMAVNSDLHWSDRRRGLAEMIRVSRRRVVVVTVDGEVAARHWLMRDYLPEAGELFAPLSAVTEALPGCTISIIPIPADCADGSVLAFWKRPEAFLDPRVTRAMAALARAGGARVDEALARLRADLRDGGWQRRNRRLLGLDTLDLGQRLVVWDHPSTDGSSSPGGW